MRLTIRDPKARADVEDNFRKTIGQLLVGAMVLGGAGVGATVAYRQLMSQQQASRDLLISIQVSKGFEQLGSDKIVMRLGGIYALEGVMNTSEQYYQAVLEALSAFVRDGTKNETGDGPPMSNIQAALTVIGRRARIAPGAPNLAKAHIPKAYLEGRFVYPSVEEDPTVSDMPPSCLRGGDLRRAILRGTDLRGADLRGAQLLHTNLSRAALFGTNLSHAMLFGTNLSGAQLAGDNPRFFANLSGA